MNIAKKIFSIILNVLMIIVVLVLIVAIYSFCQVNVFNKKYVNLCGYTFLQVKSGSMETEIRVDDIVIEKLLSPKDKIAVNDIVTFEEKDSLITHRIVDISADSEITTKGDANNSEDEPIKKSQVIGKVIKIVPNVAIWTQVFKTKSVYRLIILTVVLFIITFSINTNDDISSKTKKKEDTEEENKVEDNNEKED